MSQLPPTYPFSYVTLCFPPPHSPSSAMGKVLTVPMLYSGLIKHITADAAIGRRLERTALHAAFELLDFEDRGRVAPVLL